jgi:outer membrane protein assembly factor BamB
VVGVDPPPVLDVAAADGRAFVSAQGSHADDPTVTVPSDGTRNWAHDTGRVVALAGDVAFVDDGDRLLSLDAASGDERWTRSFDDDVTGVLPVEAGLLVETAPADVERRLQLVV